MEWPLLASLSEGDRRELLAIARRRTFARGEVVFHRDDPADTLHLIAKGRFAVRVVTPRGDTATLNILGCGAVFGELALLTDGGRRSATVVALEPAETRSVHQIDFAALRKRHPETLAILVGALAERVQALSDQLTEALFVPADRRVLRRVADLATEYGGDSTASVEIPLTQEDIAGLAGTARATVNRVLRDAERRGELRLARGRTIVLDRAELQRRAR